VYDPKSCHADENGFRRDTLGALRKLNMTTMRYPGGNFASGYHWLDGIGSKDQRPTLRELAWQSIEPNQFGTDEFIKMTRMLNWTPMFTVNLGTGTPEEARNWVEYCNSPVGSWYANLRAGSLSPSSRDSQVTGRPQLATHSLTIVVLPKPAGAEMRVSLPCRPSFSRSSRRGRGIILGRGGGI
jgi:hypothetical protein